MHVGAEVDLPALVEPQDLGAQLPHLVQRVGDEDRSRSTGDDFAHFLLALFEEGSIADREHLVQYQDVGLHEAGDGKSEAGLHAGGELLEGPVLEVLELSEGDDLVVLLVHEFTRIAQHSAAQVGVLPHGELRVEATAKLEQGGDGAVAADPALGGNHDAGHGFEECGLTRAISADDAQHLAALERKAHVLIGPKLSDVIVAGEPAHDVFLEADVFKITGEIPDGYLVCFQNCHHATSHIIQEFVVVLLIHPAADAEGKQRIRGHQQVIVPREQGGVNHDHAEVLDDEVDGVYEEEALDRGAIIIHRIEDRGHVHEKLRKHVPEVLHVSEEDKEGREDQSDAEVQEHEAADRVQEQDKAPGERDMVEHAEHEEHTEREAEVDEALDVFGEQEQILRDIHLGKDPGVIHQRAHALVGGLAEEGEHEVAAEEECRVMRGAAAEKLREHEPHHEQRQQRRQHAPCHAEHGALVFLFKIAFHQFLKEELIGFECLEHEISPELLKVR